MVKNFLNDENGAIVSIELILIITIAVLALIVGWSEVAVAVNTELNDISNAVGSLDQSFAYTGFKGQAAADTKTKSVYNGSRWDDTQDDCDGNTTCQMVCGTPAAASAG